MADFLTKNPNMGKFWRDLQWKMLVCFIALRSILGHFGLFCLNLLYLMVIWFWYVIPRKVWQPWVPFDKKVFFWWEKICVDTAIATVKCEVKVIFGLGLPDDGLF
jgi:hypothetical protein